MILEPTLLEVTNAKTGLVYQLVPIVNAYRYDDATDGAAMLALAAQLIRLTRDHGIRELIFSFDKTLFARPLQESEALAWFNEGCELWERGEWYTYLIMREGTLHGVIATGKGEVQYALEAAATGTMTPALAAVCGLVRRSHPGPVWAHVNKRNRASKRVLARCGFVRTRRAWPFIPWERYELSGN